MSTNHIAHDDHMPKPQIFSWTTIFIWIFSFCSFSQGLNLTLDAMYWNFIYCVMNINTWYLFLFSRVAFHVAGIFLFLRACLMIRPELVQVVCCAWDCRGNWSVATYCFLVGVGLFFLIQSMTRGKKCSVFKVRIPPRLGFASAVVCFCPRHARPCLFAVGWDCM